MVTVTKQSILYKTHTTQYK